MVYNNTLPFRMVDSDDNPSTGDKQIPGIKTGDQRKLEKQREEEDRKKRNEKVRREYNL